MRQRLRIYDPMLFTLAVIATCLGVIFIFDTAYARAIGGQKTGLPHDFVFQMLFVPIAGGICWLAAGKQADWWKKWSKLAWVINLVLLLAVWKFGHVHSGARRWIGVEPWSIQPAEFAKTAAIIYLAGYFADRKPWPTRMKRQRNLALTIDNVWLPKLMRCLPAVWVFAAAILIVFEPDMGTGAVIAATGFAMFIPAEVSNKSILAALAIAVVGGCIAVKHEPYRAERFANHPQRWSGGNVDESEYQTVQAELSIANGGVVGVGLGAGHAKYVMPATTTDYIWATISEETGLAGSLLVLGVLCALVWRLLWLAGRAKTRFDMLVLYGVGMWIGIQTCVNVMMANAFLPSIGIPLPFISYGGSSLLALWLAVGICQSTLAPVKEKPNVQDSEDSFRGPRRRTEPQPRKSRQLAPASFGRLQVRQKVQSRYK